MTTPPTIRALQQQLSDLIARIPPHLLLPHALDGKAPDTIRAMAQAAAGPSIIDGYEAPLTWPAGFGPYELCALHYGRAPDGRPCWDLDILGAFYNDKVTFLIWTLRFFAPSVPMQVLRVRRSIQHGKEGVGDGARFLWGFGDSGSWIQGIAGFQPALGDEHALSALSLTETLHTIEAQLAALTKRIEALEGANA